MNPSPTLRVGAAFVIAGNVLKFASNAVQPPISDYSDTIEVFTALLATPLWNVSRVGVLLSAMLGRAVCCCWCPRFAVNLVKVYLS